MELRRAALVELGLTEFGSFGATGYFVFRAPSSDLALPKLRITEVTSDFS